MTTHRFVRSFTSDVSLAASDYTASLTWTFDQLTGYTDFTSLFDYFQIDKVVLTYIWAAGTSPVSLYVTSDYDGGSALTLSQMLEHRFVQKTVSATVTTASFSVVPRISGGVYTSTGIVASSIKPSWIDLATPTVVHYGAQVVSAGASTGNTGLILRLLTQVYFRVAAQR